MRAIRFLLRVLMRPDAPLRVSLREHIRRVRERSFVLIVSGVGGVLGLIALTVPPSTGVHPHAFIPTWLWVGLLVGGIVVAQFLAFHDVRKERDEAKGETALRFDALRYRFEMEALDGTPVVYHITARDETTAEGQAGYRFVLVFANGGTEALEYEVETLSIVLAGRTAQDGTVFGSTGGIILPGKTHRFFYHPIIAPTDPILSGEGEYVVIYGHPSGGPKFRTHHKFSIGWESQSGKVSTAMWLTQGVITHELASTL